MESGMESHVRTRAVRNRIAAEIRAAAARAKGIDCVRVSSTFYKYVNDLILGIDAWYGCGNFAPLGLETRKEGSMTRFMLGDDRVKGTIHVTRKVRKLALECRRQR